MERIEDIWQREFNKVCPKYHIVALLLQDIMSCTFLTDDGKEIRLTTNQNMYNFSCVLQRKKYPHVVRIYDCFKIELPDKRGELQNVFCVVSELLKRDFTIQANVQSGINLFRDSWINYLSKKHLLDLNPYNDIDYSYSSKDDKGRMLVIERINEANCDQIVKDVALAMEGAYQKVMKLDPDALIFPYTDNVGLAQDGNIKICNIGHKFMGLDNSYEISTDSNSITVKYDPIIDEYNVKNNQMLMPLKVLVGSNEELVLGLIDTGAMSSGFSDDFFEYASLKNLGKTTVVGCTGKREAINTFCFVTFPNGQIESLRGLTISPDAEVSIVIGMDLLSRCKFESEPYCNGFKYKLTFL